MKYIFSLIAWIAFVFPNYAQITTPKAHFGFNIGDDYHLANFTQTESYFKKLASESNRVKYTVIGKTEEGRDQPMLIISNEENLKNLKKYQSIAQQLARAEMTVEDAKKIGR